MSAEADAEAAGGAEAEAILGAILGAVAEAGGLVAGGEALGAGAHEQASKKKIAKRDMS